jgi:uncharacterized protein (DUF1778 family)
MTEKMTKELNGTLLLRLRQADRELFEEAANAAGFTHVSEWVRHRLREAAKKDMKSAT